MENLAAIAVKVDRDSYQAIFEFDLGSSLETAISQVST